MRAKLGRKNPSHADPYMQQAHSRTHGQAMVALPHTIRLMCPLEASKVEELATGLGEGRLADMHCESEPVWFSLAELAEDGWLAGWRSVSCDLQTNPHRKQVF